MRHRPHVERMERLTDVASQVSAVAVLGRGLFSWYWKARSSSRSTALGDSIPVLESGMVPSHAASYMKRLVGAFAKIPITSATANEIQSDNLLQFLTNRGTKDFRQGARRTTMLHLQFVYSRPPPRASRALLRS